MKLLLIATVMASLLTFPGETQDVAAPPEASGDGTSTLAHASVSDDERILELLHGLVGEWRVHNVREDGSVFRVRNTYELGPDGQSVIARGWLGDGTSLHPHAASQIWRAPAIDGTAGSIMFQSIDENGAIARGPISLLDDHTLLWQWDMTRLTGAEDHYLVHMIFESADSYRFILFHRNEGGGKDELVNVVFRRQE